MNDELTWDDVTFEIKDKVKKFIPNCEIDTVETQPTGEEGEGLEVKIRYSVK